MDEKKFIEDAFNSIPKDSQIFITKLTDISDLVKKNLKEKKWSISDLSKAIKKDEKKVYSWLNGISNITLKDITEIESVLNIDIIKIQNGGSLVDAYIKEYQKEQEKMKKNIYKKFIDTIEIDEWEVETDTGWSEIKAIGKTVEYDEWILKTEGGLEIICADTHIIFDEFKNEVFVKDLYEGQTIQTKNGLDQILSVEKSEKKSNMFDLQLNDENHRYYTNGILSHNSMWLYNIACNSANQGKNAVVITVEMGWRKVIKRLGAMRLKIDVDQYSELSKDSIFIKNKINALKNTGNGLFNTENPGKIYVKKFNTGSCTVSDIDNYLTKLQETKGIKVDVVVLDYINLMSADKANKDIATNLYQKGKHLAEGLRYIADKFDLALITATQVDKAVWGANDIKLADIPESKAVAETADSVWAIIRNTEMKKHNKYKLKILKLRDGDHKEEMISFDFHPQFLTIENDILDS